MASGHGNQQAPHESPTRASAAITPARSGRRCGCARRGGPALGRGPPRARAASRRRTDQAGAAEEGQDDEADPQDDGVDVEVAGEPAGDAGDLAVVDGAAQPAEVADLVAGDARARRRGRDSVAGDGSGRCVGGVVVMAPACGATGFAPSGTTLILPGPAPPASGSGRGFASWVAARAAAALCDGP